MTRPAEEAGALLPELEAALDSCRAVSSAPGSYLGRSAKWTEKLAPSLTLTANQSAEEWRQFQGLEVLPRIEKVFPRIVDYPELPVPFRVRIRSDLVKFPTLE